MITRPVSVEVRINRPENWVSVRNACGIAIRLKAFRPRLSNHSLRVEVCGSVGTANGTWVITTVVQASPGRSRPSPKELSPNSTEPSPAEVRRKCSSIIFCLAVSPCTSTCLRCAAGISSATFSIFQREVNSTMLPLSQSSSLTRYLAISLG